MAAAISILCSSIYQPDLSSGQFNNRYLGELVAVIHIVTAIFSLVQGAKRMHDVGKSGWYALIPVYNLILAFFPGTPGNNQYGENPRERGVSEADGITPFLASAFVSCGVYALLSITELVDDTTIRGIIALISFAVCSLYFLRMYVKDRDKEKASGK